MTVEIMKTTFLLRRGTAEAWESNNPILRYGEPGYDKTNRGLKIGDGETAWNDLEYIGVDSATLEAIIQEYLKDLPAVGESAVYIPHVSEDGMLSWTNDAGLKNPDPVSIKGRDGNDGRDGKDGKDGEDGQPGAPGIDGITPHIGENGNWFIGEQDTGVPATGPMGPAGPAGSGDGSAVMPELGNGLYYDEDGKLAVLMAENVEEDNTLPISSAAVSVTVGNIDALLKLI